MITAYKTVRPDLTSFRDPGYQWRIGGAHRPTTPKHERRAPGHPDMDPLCNEWYLYAAATPPQATVYSQWPYRLLEVEGKPALGDNTKMAFRQLKVLRELPVEECFGPNGAAVLTVIRQAETYDWANVPQTAWDAAWTAARDAAGTAAGTLRTFWFCRPAATQAGGNYTGARCVRGRGGYEPK